MTELMLLLRTLTACYAGAMGVPYGVEVDFEGVETGYQAQTSVDVEYLTAYISYDLEELAEESDSTLRLVVVHEVTHVLTWELGLLADEADVDASLQLFEQLATRVERWPMWQEMCSASSH